MSALQLLGGEVEDFSESPAGSSARPPVLIHDDAVATHLYHIAQEAVNNAHETWPRAQHLLRLAAEERMGHVADHR